MNVKAFLLALSLVSSAAGCGITTIEGTWTDEGRSRDIPYKIYAPQNVTGRCPVIIFSHGLGGTREGYGYLGSFWASNGYISVHLQHGGSDDAVWRGSKHPMQDMKRAAANPMNAINRPGDVSFAIDRLASMETNGVLRGHIDTNRIGVAGHSFGAFTSLAIAGQKLGLRGKSLGDSRIKAAVAMSAPVPRGGGTAGFDGIHIPVMHMTGTKDVSPISDTTAEQRRVPFDKIAGADQYLVNFNGGDHMIFSGSRRTGNGSDDARFQALIRAGTLAFWDAYLRGDAKAREWLQVGGYAKELAESASLELKKVPASAR